MGTSSSKELQDSNATTGGTSASGGLIHDTGSVVVGSPPSIGHRRQGSFAKQDKIQSKKKKNQRQPSTSSSSCSSTSNSRRPSSSFDKSQTHSSSSIDTNIECNGGEFILDKDEQQHHDKQQQSPPLISTPSSLQLHHNHSHSSLHHHHSHQHLNDRSSSNNDLNSISNNNSTSVSLINTPNDCHSPNHHSNNNNNKNHNNNELSSSISSTTNSLSSMVLHNESPSLRDHQIIICEHCHQISTSRPSSAFRPNSSMSNSIDYSRSRTNSTNRHNNNNNNNNININNSVNHNNNLILNNIIKDGSNNSGGSNHGVTGGFSFNNSVNSTATFGYDSDEMRNINQLTISNNSINQYFQDDDSSSQLSRLSPTQLHQLQIQLQQQQLQLQQQQLQLQQQQQQMQQQSSQTQPPSLNNSFSNFNQFPLNNNNINLSISSPSIITPTTNRLSNGLQLTPFPPSSSPSSTSTTNDNSNENNSNNLTTSILHSSIGSTSELFNKSLISSFLSSTNNQIQLQPTHQPLASLRQSTSSTANQSLQQSSSGAPTTTTTTAPSLYNSISPPTTPRHYQPREFSYDTKDTFTITVSNSELNSMISDNSIGSIGSGFQRLTVSSSSQRNGGIRNSSHHHNDHNNTSNGSNDSLFFAQKKEMVSDYTKDITFLHSDHESVKEKSTSSTTSSSNNNNSNSNNRNNLSVSQQRPRGRSISDSLFMSMSTKDCINDIQKALENEKIKRNRFNELKEILNDRNDIIEISDIQFVQKVGEGAFSEVWEGWWKGLHVAVKKLKIIGDEEQFKERFLREVENLKKGNHQNIVMFMGACYKPACIITEYMSGGSLYNALHNPNTPKAKYSFPLVLKMATDIALGLMHLHTLNIVHRDLTSQNILLDELGNLKISDFGLSREKPRDGSMTMTNGGICNPRWRPPEITKNLGHYSEKMDVYCFSLVVWELLVGEIPFSDLDGSQASAQVAYAGLRPTIPETCDRDFADLLVQCWDTDPAKRPHFPYIVSKLKEISWNNPIGFVSRDSSESSTPRSLSPIKN